MVATVIDGWAIASFFRQEIAQKVKDFKAQKGHAPKLSVLLVGDNPASHIYVRNKRKACEDVGISSDVHLLPSHTPEEDIIERIQGLNADKEVHGILLQMPLPVSFNASRIISSLAPHKDVDGLHPQNLGLLFAGHPHFVPCTPLGCLHLIHSVMPSLKGKRVVVIGRSVLVGRPMASLLGLQDATVVQAHSHTQNLAEECRRADILVCAVGSPGLITGEFIKPGAVVIDVGTTRVGRPDGASSLQGDVAFEEVKNIAGFLTPVPGGVGPMTISYLLLNTLIAAEGLI